MPIAPKPPAKPATPARPAPTPARPAPAPARPAPAPAKAPTPAPAPARPAAPAPARPAPAKSSPAGVAVAPRKAPTPAPAPSKSTPGGISVARPAPAKAASPVFSLNQPAKASPTAPKAGSAAAITAAKKTATPVAKAATSALAKAATSASKTTPGGVSIKAGAAASAPIATPAGFAPAQVPSPSQYMPSYAAPEANVTKGAPNKEASNAMAGAASVQSSGKATPTKAASLAKTAAHTLARAKASGMRPALKGSTSKAIPTKVSSFKKAPAFKAPGMPALKKAVSRVAAPRRSALTKATANLARAAASVVKAQVADAAQASPSQLAAPARTKLRQMPARVVTPYVGASPRVFPSTTRQDDNPAGVAPSNTGAPAFRNAPITTADSGNYATHRMGYVEANQQSQQRIGPGFYSLSRLSNVPFIKIVGVARSEKTVTWGERFEIPAGETGRVANASYHAGEIVLNGGKDVNLGPRRITVPFNLIPVDGNVPDGRMMPDTRVDTRGAKAVWAVIPITSQPEFPLTFSPFDVYNFAIERANNTANNIGAPFQGTGAASRIAYTGGNSPARFPLGYMSDQGDIREVTMCLLDAATFVYDEGSWIIYQPLNADSPTYFVIEY